VQRLIAKDWPQIALPGSRLFLGSGAACPHALISSLLAEQGKLADLELIQVFTLGPTPWREKRDGDPFRTNAFFFGTGNC